MPRIGGECSWQSEEKDLCAVSDLDEQRKQRTSRGSNGGGKGTALCPRSQPSSRVGPELGISSCRPVPGFWIVLMTVHRGQSGKRASV